MNTSNTNKLKFIYAAAASVLFFGCASFSLSYRGVFFADGVYSFDYERIIDCVEVAAIYKSYGIDAKQDITKKMHGSAVFVKNRQFVDPETKILLTVAANGAISSPQNETIHGKYTKKGDAVFQGFYEENGQLVHLTVQGRLLRSDHRARASFDYDGEFTMTDSGTGRKQYVAVKDGLYLWRYAEERQGDFEPWPIIVHSDGSVDTGLELLSRTVIKDQSEMIFDTVHQANGKISPSGSIAMTCMTTTTGSGIADVSQPFVYSGKRLSSEESVVMGDDIYTMLTVSPYAGYTKAKNMPEWYTDYPEAEKDFLVAAAKKTHSDKETALRIAESCAASDIVSSISISVRLATEAKHTGTYKYLYRLADSTALQSIPYAVRRQYYDETSHTAFVIVELRKSKADRIINEILAEKSSR